MMINRRTMLVRPALAGTAMALSLGCLAGQR